MKITRQGGSYYTNYKNFTRLRPKYRPDGNSGREGHPSGLIWSDATMTWDELYSTYEDIA